MSTSITGQGISIYPAPDDALSSTSKNPVQNKVIDEEITDVKNAISQKAPLIINTASGDIASFADGADGMQIRKIVGTIVPVQSGTGDPSPDNVRPISGWTGANIFARGKNLLDADGLIGNSFTKNANGTYTLGFVGTELPQRTSANAPIRLKFGITHRWSMDVATTATASSQIIVRGYKHGDTSGTDLYRAGIQQSNITFTFVDNGYESIRLLLSGGSEAVGSVFVLSNIEITIGSSATEYESYHGTTLPINWQSEAGTIYGGSITLNEDGSADVVADKAGYDMGDFTYDNDDVSIFQLSLSSMPILSGRQFAGLIYCSSYKPMYSTSLGTLRQVIQNGEVMGRNTFRELYFKDTRFTETADFKAAVAGQTLVVPLENPISYHFDNIGQLYTYLGTNNVWIDTGTITECDYPADTKLYVDGLTEPDEDMIADANIASGKYFVVNNQLYLSTAAIAAGASIVPGTNCTATNLAEALNALNT